MYEDILKEDSDGVSLKVRVQPGASRNEILGVVQGALRIRLTARPVEGEANKACIRFLSKRLGVAKSRVMIVRGTRSREKILHIQGIPRSELLRALLGDSNGCSDLCS